MKAWRQGALKDAGEWFEHVMVRGQDALHINKAYVDAFCLLFLYMDEGDASVKASSGRGDLGAGERA